jgi:hypothetical protein
MDTNNANPPTSGAVTNSGTYEPDVLFQNNFLAPADYEYEVAMRQNDDDIIGLVWNYQDPDNYFRVGIRQQAAGSFGGTQGLSVQKIVGGTLTQLIPSVVGPGPASPITQAMIDTRAPITMKVAVTGSNYEIFFNGASVGSGMDTDLVAGRKVGLQSWAEQADAAAVTPFWGAEFESVSVSDNTGTLFSQTLAPPIKWRNVVMENSDGISGLTGTTSRETLGNLGLSVDHNWVYQQSNGFQYATASTPNVDFIGPAAVIDEPGANNWSDYDLKVRMGAVDNDGIGVIVRAQDNDNFYRINFSSQSIVDATNSRAPGGLSIQKVKGGVWSEVFRDDQTMPFFTYTSAASTAPTTDNTPATGMPMFDLRVIMVGNTFDIEVIDLFNGNTVKHYPLITDATDPLLTGSVGLTTWGTENVFWSMYGGDNSNTPFLLEIPEPSAVCLALIAAVFGCSLARRR